MLCNSKYLIFGFILVVFTDVEAILRGTLCSVRMSVCFFVLFFEFQASLGVFVKTNVRLRCSDVGLYFLHVTIKVWT